MNIEKEAIDAPFVVGYGGVDAATKAIVVAGYANKVLKGVRVRAATANTITIYVGPTGVSVTTGYPLPAGEELSIPIEDPSQIHVVATPADNQQQTVTIADGADADTFTLSFRGATTAALAWNITNADLQTALRALSTINGANCTVTGDAGGPYTVEFIGTLAKQDVDLMVGVGTDCTVTIAKVADITAGSKYSWFGI